MADGDSADWMVELEAALLDNLDGKHLQNGKPIQENLRADFWQTCLGVNDEKNISFDEVFDLPEQNALREDCQQLVADKFGNEDDDKVSIVSDLECVLTHHCKRTHSSYTVNDGWLELLTPLLALKLTRSQLYHCFREIVGNFVPRNCVKNGRPFHFFRLLVLYHDPELCSFLDTEKITPDAFAMSWFKSLFSSACSLLVIQNMWDIYFHQNDPFFVYYLGLVILLNAKDQLVGTSRGDRQSIIDMLTVAPSALEEDDIEDFCSLAKYYASKTPPSISRDFRPLLFEDDGPDLLASQLSLNQALCLPVSVDELTQTKMDATKSVGVRFFVVDCRPAEQYNSGHLPTAFHLDAALMLFEPTAFQTAVDALFTAQQQALSADSVAAGEHLCFMGSGREEEDQYVHMVVASFLQKHTQYVSIARGGYRALHELMREDLKEGLKDHNIKGCLMCNPGATGNGETSSTGGDPLETEHFSRKKNSILGRFLNAKPVKEMTDKLTDFIQNNHGGAQPVERHVSSDDKVGKLYRNMASVFTIDDDHEDDGSNRESFEEEIQDIVCLPKWLKKPEIIDHFPCHQVNENGYTYPSQLVVTTTHLYILRDVSDKPNFAYVISRRPLTSIMKITSKRRRPELITFKYSSPNGGGEPFLVSDLDRFLIPKAGEATKCVKLQCFKLMSAETNADET